MNRITIMFSMLMAFLCVLLVGIWTLAVDEKLPKESDELIVEEIAEEHGVPVEAVCVTQVRKISANGGTFFLVDVLVEDEDLVKMTYAVKLDEDNERLILDWRVKEGE